MIPPSFLQDLLNRVGSIADSIVGIVLPTLGLIFLGVASWILLFVIRLTRTRRARAQAY